MRVIFIFRFYGLKEVPLSVEHRQRAETRLHEQLRRIAEFDCAGTRILPAGDGIDFQMHAAARVEVGDALAICHCDRILVLADGQDDLSLVHLIWHMASFPCGLIVSNMYSWGGFPPFQQPSGRVENPPAIESVENR